MPHSRIDSAVTVVRQASKIQAALDAMVTRGGGTVVLQAGRTFVLPDTLVIGSNTTLDARGATVRLGPALDRRMLESQGTQGASRDSNITIIGGLWDRAANGGSGNNSHSLVFRKVDGLVIRDVAYTSTGAKYGLLIQNCTEFLVDGFEARDCSSDGVHIQGPAERGEIRNVFGTAGDDLVAITPLDYTAYVWGDEGDVRDITISGVYADNCAANIVKVLGGNGVTCERIAVDHVRGSTGSTAVWLGDDAATANTIGGFIDGITVRDVAVTTPDTRQIHVSATNGGRIHIDGLRFEAAGVVQGGINIAPGAVVESLNVTNGTVVDGSTAHGFLDISGTVSNLIVNGLSGNLSAINPRLVAIYTGATVRRLSLANISVLWADASGSFVSAAFNTSTVNVIAFSNISINGAPAWLCDIATTTTLLAHGVSKPSGNVLNVRATGVITLWAEASDMPGSSTVASGGVLKSKALGFRVDVSKLSPTAGDLAYNTNGALGCGVGPVVSNGTNWKHLYTGATS